MTAGDAVPTIPSRIEPKSLDDYLEVMTRAVFQAGVTWIQIAEHWGAYRRAFHNFNCTRVAQFDDTDVDRALMEPSILHSERKVRATAANARTLIELDESRGGFRTYLRSFADYPALAKDF